MTTKNPFLKELIKTNITFRKKPTVYKDSPIEMAKKGRVKARNQVNQGNKHLKSKCSKYFGRLM